VIVFINVSIHDIIFKKSFEGENKTNRSDFAITARKRDYFISILKIFKLSQECRKIRFPKNMLYRRGFRSFLG